jgi:hypothetical protein
VLGVFKRFKRFKRCCRGLLGLKAWHFASMQNDRNAL